MDFTDISNRGLVMLGCGKMGSAMLAGWLAAGLKPGAVTVRDPYPSDWVLTQGVQVNTDFPENPAVVIIAVKPQMMGDALPQMAALGDGDTLFISVAAGVSIKGFQDVLGQNTPIVRCMPNTPAAVGRGITALIGNGAASAAHVGLADGLLAAVGQTVRLETEAQIDAVTAVSGSGPAYVFHLIEAMAAAGEKLGLTAEMSLHLARATVAGAGHLAEKSDEDPSQLRVNVTSPGGTTAAALAVLMDTETGFPDLLMRAMNAAADRSRELGA